MFPLETKVLIVDDNAGARSLIKSQLQLMGFNDSVEAADGILGLEKLRAQATLGKPFGLALVDWHMPKMNGLEMLVEVRQDPALQKLPFIMITTEDDMDSVVTAITKRVSDYMVKPVNEETLRKKLEAVWKKHAAGK